MTRTRIVKGNITEITGGTASTYGNRIIINAGERIRFHAEHYTYGDPGEVPVGKHAEFDIDFELGTDEKTVVPFGILDFKNNPENPFFSFKYTLRNKDIDLLDFKISDEEGNVIYQISNMKPVIIQAKKKPILLFEAKKPSEGPLISKTWDYQKLFDPYVLEAPDFTKVGEYHLNWDGFDNNEIYDSTRFAGKKLKAEITAEKDGKRKTKTVEFETAYDQVNWTDVKIDRNKKRIDVTLRVNLKDGGAEGLSCNTYTTPKEESYETFTPTNSQDPFNGMKIKQCDWDNISQEALAYYKQVPIKTRTISFEQISKITLDGINTFWSRNSKNIGKGIAIYDDLYGVYVDAKSHNMGLPAPEIIYQTNTEEGRSRNWEASRILYYYEGYLYRDYWKKLSPSKILYANKGWEHVHANIPDFKMVSGHEIGHEILLTYGGHQYSKTHKGTSHWSMIIQDPDEDATYIPKTGEIDLMKYYLDYYDISRTVVSEFDVLKLIWLTKIKIS